MHILLAILIFSLLSLVALGEQGTVSTDDTEASQSPASLSGYRMGESKKQAQEDMDMREEEVQINDDEYIDHEGRTKYDPEKVQQDEEQYPLTNGTP